MVANELSDVLFWQCDHDVTIVLLKMFSRWFLANKKLIIMLRMSKFGDLT